MPARMIEITNARGWTAVPNDILRNPELGALEVRILAIFKSCRVDWSPSMKQITSWCGCSSYARHKATQNLEQLGYLRHVRIIDSKGRFDCVWFWSFDPVMRGYTEDQLLEIDGSNAKKIGDNSPVHPDPNFELFERPPSPSPETRHTVPSPETRHTHKKNNISKIESFASAHDSRRERPPEKPTGATDLAEINGHHAQEKLPAACDVKDLANDLGRAVWKVALELARRGSKPGATDEALRRQVGGWLKKAGHGGFFAAIMQAKANGTDDPISYINAAVNKIAARNHKASGGPDLIEAVQREVDRLGHDDDRPDDGPAENEEEWAIYQELRAKDDARNRRLLNGH